MIEQKYTPFMTSAGEKIAQGLSMRNQQRQQQQEGQLMGDAMMGDQQSLQNLYMYNPKLAAQVQQRNEAQAAAARQAEMAAREKVRESTIAFQDYLRNDIMPQAAKIEDDEESRQFILNAAKSRASVLGLPDPSQAVGIDLQDPDFIPRLRQAYAGFGRKDKIVRNTTELGGGVVQLIYNDGSRELVEPTKDEMDTIRLAQEQDISMEEARAQRIALAKGKGQLQSEIESHPEVLAMQRELEEMKSQVEQNKQKEIARIQAAAKVDASKVESANTYDELLPSLQRFKSLVDDGIYTGSWKDSIERGVSMLGVIADEDKLQRTAQARMIATALKFKAKPTGMGAMSDSEWGIIKEAIPNPESATLAEIKAGIEEFERLLADRMTQEQSAAREPDEIDMEINAIKSDLQAR